MSDATTTNTNTFPALPAEATPHEQEQALLEQWRAEGLFHRVQDARAGDRKSVV